jgi:hypothetical protein
MSTWKEFYTQIRDPGWPDCEIFKYHGPSTQHTLARSISLASQRV